MRYELTDHEWAAIKPFLPKKPRGVPRRSSGSLIRSSSVVGSQLVTTSSRPTTSPSSSLRQSGFGCALMSPRPKRQPNPNHHK
jgi:hypothetical protein